MEDATVAPSNAENIESTLCDDQDLAMALRESAQHEKSVQNEAYRQALSELAGELYVEAYKSTLQQAIERQRKAWNVGHE